MFFSDMDRQKRWSGRSSGDMTTAGDPALISTILGMERPGDLATDDSTAVIPAVTADGPTQGSPGRKRSWKRVLIVTLVALLVIAGGATAATALYVRSVEKSIVKVDAFTEVPEESRPVKEATAANALNLLLLGSDSRDPENTTGSRSDTIIVAHLPADRSGAQLISIPRDTWVHVPASADGRNGNADAKINAAYAWGGIPLMVQTVEEFTTVRIDHVVLIDFGGFSADRGRAGRHRHRRGAGLHVDPRAVPDVHDGHLAHGRRHRTGLRAAAIPVHGRRLRPHPAPAAGDQGDPGQGASGGMLSSPAGINDFVKATANSVSVDQTLSIVDLATQMRNVRGGNLTFLTTPTTGTG